jgi:hypothetical protein
MTVVALSDSALALDAALSAALQRAGAGQLETMQAITLADRLATWPAAPATWSRCIKPGWRITRPPFNHIIQFNLGVTLAQLNQFAAAEAAYRAAIN